MNIFYKVLVFWITIISFVFIPFPIQIIENSDLDPEVSFYMYPPNGDRYGVPSEHHMLNDFSLDEGIAQTLASSVSTSASDYASLSPTQRRVNLYDNSILNEAFGWGFAERSDTVDWRSNKLSKEIDKLIT